MADSVQRVGLVFKEDGSTDFIKSLQLVNATLKENYEMFKLTQSQWDKNTTVTQKLQDRLNYLNEAYDIQKSKVNILKTELEELESAENKDEVAIQKKKAALAQAESQLQRYGNQIKDVNNKIKTHSEELKQLGKNLEETGKKIESAGNKIKAFSAASAAALVASAKNAIDLDDAFVGVEKTVDGTAEEMAVLKQGIRDMSKEIPASAVEIAGVAEAAGQLGIKQKDILSFTRTMIDLGNATNLSSEEAASSLAKFANVTKMSAEDYSRLGSVVVALGNNFATTEADIVAMSTRLASTGELTGLTEAQIMALATAMSSVGIEAEAGGSAMSKLLQKIQTSVVTGDKNLTKFAKVAGMTGKEFKKAFEEDALTATTKFIQGLSTQGDKAIVVLNDMGIKETRLTNTVLSLASSGELLTQAIELSNKAWDENSALSEEASKRYNDLKSRITILLNKVKDISVTIGNKMMPTLEKMVEWLDKTAKKFDDLSDEQVELIVKVGLVVAALSPFLTILGKTVSGVGTAIKGFAKLKEGIGAISGTATTAGSAMNGLSTIIGALTSPVGLACTAIAVSIGAIAIASAKANAEVKKDFEAMGKGASDFVTGINNAESYLSSFNSTLFATAEEQQKLQSNMNEVQEGITKICKLATEERRDYTEGEIKQLDEYFKKLNELNQRQLEIQNQISGAITQQAVDNAKNFDGSLEEYKIYAENWIKTARDHKDETISLIEEQSIQEIALLNQRYSSEEARQSEAYQTEYNNIMTQKQQKIDAANSEVAEITATYADGYLKRLEQDQNFASVIQSLNSSMEVENQRHEDKLREINDNAQMSESSKQYHREEETNKHVNNVKKIYKELSKGMSDEQAEQLGVLMGMSAEADLYGGKLSESTRNTVDNIINNFNQMPNGTRTAMKNSMDPMLDEMEKAEPKLFAKALSIGEGIVNRLRKVWDQHSPSKVFRKLMKYNMQPMEEELDKGRKNLAKQSEKLANDVKEEMSDIEGNVSISHKTETSGLNNYEQQFDYNKMAQAFIMALKNCKLTIDDDGFAKFIDNRLMEVI